MGFLDNIIRLAAMLLIPLIGLGALLLLSHDVTAGTSSVRKCPRCGGRRSLRKYEADEFSDLPVWRCTRCGNDKDEFGNPL